MSPRSSRSARKSNAAAVVDGPTPLALRDRLVRAGMIDVTGETEDPDSTRQRILRAAIKLFADRGFDACTMRDLGREVGIKAPAIYNYYSSKEDILAAASRDALRRFFTVLIGPLGEDPPKQQLQAMVRRWVVFEIQPREWDIARANDALIDTGALERLLPAEEWEEIADALRTFIKLIATLITELTGTESRVLVSAFIAVCDRSWRNLGHEHGLDPEEIADQIWEICERMLAVGSQQPAS